METINLFALLAKWGELLLHVGNPAWEKQYRSYRCDIHDDKESGLKNCLLAQMVPVLDQIDRQEVSVQIGGFQTGEIEQAMRGLGLLLFAPLSKDLKGRIALITMHQVELPVSEKTLQFLKDPEVTLDASNLWTAEHFLQLIDQADFNLFTVYFRRWFVREDVNLDLRTKWAFVLWRDYLRGENLWPKSSVRYKVKRNQKSWIKIWKIGKTNLKSDFSSFFYTFLGKCKEGK